MASAAKGKVRLTTNVGVNYGKDDTRVEAGVPHDFPAAVAKTLIRDGFVDPVTVGVIDTAQPGDDFQSFEPVREQ